MWSPGILIKTTIRTRTHSQSCALTAIQSRGVAFEERVMTHRHPHASRLMREAASRLVRLAKSHTFKRPTLGIQTAHLEADNVQQLHCATGTLINISVVRQVLSRTSRLPIVLWLVFRQMLS